MDSASVPSWSKLNSHLYTHITMATLEASILRGQATRDAQSTIAATWVWEEKTVVQWDGSLTAINTKKVAVSDLEADMLAKYAEQLLRHGSDGAASLSDDWLREHGWG